MKIVRFPGSTNLPTNAVLDPNRRLSIGPVAFTCTACGEINTANFTNMVFRSLEFYCLGCGSPFRIVNPAFGGCRSKH